MFDHFAGEGSKSTWDAYPCTKSGEKVKTSSSMMSPSKRPASRASVPRAGYARELTIDECRHHPTMNDAGVRLLGEFFDSLCIPPIG